MAPPFSLLIIIIILSLSQQPVVIFAAKKPAGGGGGGGGGGGKLDLVRSSCIHASYPNICIRTLSSYAGGQAPKTPREVAQAAVKVSLSRAHKVSEYLVGLMKSSSSSGSSSSSRSKGAVSDCVEQIHESVVELSNTLSELKHLRTGTFRWQMSNAETWVSAALTNEDTCLDGFKELIDNHHQHVRSDVNRLITNVARITSNALYLINRLDHE